MDYVSDIYRRRLQDAPWATNEVYSLENRLLRWTYDAMLKQRGIMYDDIAEELGISRSAVGQMMDRILTTEVVSVKTLERLDTTISKISVKKHAALNHTFCRSDDDGLCIGISLSIPDQKVAEAKYRGEYERLHRTQVPGQGFRGEASSVRRARRPS